MKTGAKEIEKIAWRLIVKLFGLEDNFYCSRELPRAYEELLSHAARSTPIPFSEWALWFRLYSNYSQEHVEWRLQKTEEFLLILSKLLKEKINQ